MIRPVIDPTLAEWHGRHNGAAFLSPTSLSVAPLPLTRLAFVGSCHLITWGFHRTNPSGVPVDVINTNNGSPPPPYDPDMNYDFQVVQMPLAGLMGRQFATLGMATAEAHEKLFTLACKRLAARLEHQPRRLDLRRELPGAAGKSPRQIISALRHAKSGVFCFQTERIS